MKVQLFYFYYRAIRRPLWAIAILSRTFQYLPEFLLAVLSIFPIIVIGWFLNLSGHYDHFPSALFPFSHFRHSFVNFIVIRIFNERVELLENYDNSTLNPYPQTKRSHELSGESERKFVTWSFQPSVKFYAQGVRGNSEGFPLTPLTPPWFPPCTC